MHTTPGAISAARCQPAMRCVTRFAGRVEAVLAVISILLCALSSPLCSGERTYCDAANRTCLSANRPAHGMNWMSSNQGTSGPGRRCPRIAIGPPFVGSWWRAEGETENQTATTVFRFLVGRRVVGPGLARRTLRPVRRQGAQDRSQQSRTSDSGEGRVVLAHSRRARSC